MHTLDILELLLKSDYPLKTRYISNTTGVSQRTTYRILQTLADRGYLAQDLEGKFSLLNRSKLKNTCSITGWLKRMSTNGQQIRSTGRSAYQHAWRLRSLYLLFRLEHTVVSMRRLSDPPMRLLRLNG